MSRSIPRIALVEFREEFLTEKYVSWLNDPEVVKYSEQRHNTHTLESCTEYIKSSSALSCYVYAITIKKSGLHIGNLNAYIDEKNGFADMGIIIGDKSVWGQGYATEAWLLGAKVFFERFDLYKLTGGALSVNEGMLKVMTKCQMVPDGTRKRHMIWQGRRVDEVNYAFFKESISDG